MKITINQPTNGKIENLNLIEINDENVRLSSEKRPNKVRISGWGRSPLRDDTLLGGVTLTRKEVEFLAQKMGLLGKGV